MDLTGNKQDILGYEADFKSIVYLSSNLVVYLSYIKPVNIVC